MFDIFLRRCIPINKNFFNESFNCKLKKAGWVKIDSGKTKDIDYNERSKKNVEEWKHAIFTSKPINFYFNSMHERGWDFIYSISLSIRDVVTHPYIELLYKDYKNSAYFEDYVHDHMLLEESEKWDDE